MLTDNDKSFIREKRLLGWGYKSIASCLQVSRDTVRSYCKTAGLIGWTPSYYEMKPTHLDTCKHCGQQLLQPKLAGRKRKFCSEVCRRSWWKEHPEAKTRKESALYTFTCQTCGKSFVAYGNKNRKYCSRSCASKSRRNIIKENKNGKDRS